MVNHLTAMSACFSAGLFVAGAIVTGSVIAGSTSAHAEEVVSEFTGYMGFEARAFLHDGLYEDQENYCGSTALNLEYYRDWDGGNQRFVATGFGRVDSQDSERSHVDIRELYWWKAFDDFELYAGVRKVFWGVTETVHLVDIINQDDGVEDIDGEDKLGQPMVSVLLERDWGTLELFGLIGFRERTFPGSDGRLRGPLPVDTDNPLYQSSAEQQHLDFAARWSQVFGDWDVGVSHFIGTSRDPSFVLVSSALDPSAVSLSPYYPQIQQTGLDVQTVVEDWLWKLEAISVKADGEGRNTAAVGGFEYTLVGLAESNADLGLILEYQFDDRRGAVATSMQNDIAFGTRWVWNDMQSTELLATMSIDMDNHSRFASIEATRRLNDHWLLEMQARWFSNMAEDDPGYVLRNDDYIQLEVRRYF